MIEIAIQTLDIISPIQMLLDVVDVSRPVLIDLDVLDGYCLMIDIISNRRWHRIVISNDPLGIVDKWWVQLTHACNYANLLYYTEVKQARSTVCTPISSQAVQPTQESRARNS